MSCTGRCVTPSGPWHHSRSGCSKHRAGRRGCLGYGSADAAVLCHALALAEPDLDRVFPPERIDSKPMPAWLGPGTVLSFEARLCPLVRTKTADRRRHRELDAFLHRALATPDEPLAREVVYTDWLAQKLAGGADLLAARMTAFTLAPLVRRAHASPNNRTPTRDGPARRLLSPERRGAARRPDIVLAGTLRVADPDQLHVAPRPRRRPSPCLRLRHAPAAPDRGRLMALLGRLGLETARIPHADRHGLVWLERGRLHAEDGTLRFTAAGSPTLAAGDYAIPFQGVSLVLLGPGSTVTHDTLRLLARHGTGLVAVGEGGVRLYSAPQVGPDDSALARRQARVWADPDTRTGIARRMFVWRFGEVSASGRHDRAARHGGRPGQGGYRLLAEKHRVPWGSRRYDRNDPEATDAPNQAINHAASAVEGAAMIAVAATATIPQLGFLHEDCSRTPSCSTSPTWSARR